jgi:predicted dehydrogenase
MILTPEQRTIGRRNFLRALAGTPALATLTAAAARDPLRGGPMRLGFIGVGSQGRSLLAAVDPAIGDVRAICDINPASLARADQVRAARRQPAVRHYVEWREMLERENLEAVVVAVPLWAHADLVTACLDAGQHVLCEKMMAWDVAGCQRMKAAAEKSGRVLEIGYHRYYSSTYRAAYDGIMRRGLLGDIYHARLAWHRNGNWRRAGGPPSPGYDPSKWGYPTFDHLWNWRLYGKYSRGLFAELGSHHVNATNWFVGAAPRAVIASGGVHRFKDGRESDDHVYGIFEYPNGLTATFSSIESSAFEQHYEAFYGTKATLIMYNESEALLFNEGGGGAATAVEVSGAAGGAAISASETKPAASAGATRSSSTAATPTISSPAASVSPNGTAVADRSDALSEEIARFCVAVRTGQPVACGPDRAMDSARACIAAAEAAATRTRIAI